MLGPPSSRRHGLASGTSNVIEGGERVDRPGHPVFGLQTDAFIAGADGQLSQVHEPGTDHNFGRASMSGFVPIHGLSFDFEVLCPPRRREGA